MSLEPQWSYLDFDFKIWFRARKVARTFEPLRLASRTLYSYFEKGCRIKCTRQPRKVLWVVLSSLFFKEIWKNDRRDHGRMFASAKGKQQK